MGKIIALALRSLQFLFSVVVLGTSISLIRGQVYGHAPAVTYTSAIVGAIGILASLLGFTAIFITALDGVVTLAVDGLASVLFIALALAMSIKLGVHSCSDLRYTFFNAVINGGSYLEKTNHGEISIGLRTPSDYQHRCRTAGADAAFLWFGFFAFAVMIVYGILARRKNYGGASYA